MVLKRRLICDTRHGYILGCVADRFEKSDLLIITPSRDCTIGDITDLDDGGGVEEPTIAGGDEFTCLAPGWRKLVDGHVGATERLRIGFDHGVGKRADAIDMGTWADFAIGKYRGMRRGGETDYICCGECVSAIIGDGDSAIGVLLLQCGLELLGACD
jgi:hypothetical protein